MALELDVVAFAFDEFPTLVSIFEGLLAESGASFAPVDAANGLDLFASDDRLGSKLGSMLAFVIVDVAGVDAVTTDPSAFALAGVETA